jgi:hypothetical protein
MINIYISAIISLCGTKAPLRALKIRGKTGLYVANGLEKYPRIGARPNLDRGLSAFYPLDCSFDGEQLGETSKHRFFYFNFRI